ncbi:DUF6264 family protein [Microbacterium aurum]|uniref:DUF6264 family protein n=1 Tax=Microbacterium aurum TaxID=36805 RepID=UPI001EF74D9D|nr:DUF6264 family protein [Microbacterium aurum]
MSEQAPEPRPAPRTPGADERSVTPGADAAAARPHGAAVPAASTSPAASSLPARPQYGEYATPEQQRAAIREPLPQVPAAVATAPAAPAHPPTARPTTAAARPTRPADRIITVALLAYGLVTVLSAVPQLWHFTDFAQTWMQVAGIDETFTNTAQGDLWGRIGAVVFVVGWVATAVTAWRSLVARRLSWWIPLVGAIVTFVIASICLTVPLLGDPAVASHFGA